MPPYVLQQQRDCSDGRVGKIEEEEVYFAGQSSEVAIRSEDCGVLRHQCIIRY